jgi:hypothetical protein
VYVLGVDIVYCADRLTEVFHLSIGLGTRLQLLICEDILTTPLHDYDKMVSVVIYLSIIINYWAIGLVLTTLNELWPRLNSRYCECDWMDCDFSTGATGTGSVMHTNSNG